MIKERRIVIEQTDGRPVVSRGCNIAVLVYLCKLQLVPPPSPVIAPGRLPCVTSNPLSPLPF